MELIIIVARAKNGVIGVNNQLPWKLPEDLKHFKEMTLGHPIIMGRNTWESLGRPLPGRRNLVVTRNSAYNPEGAEVFNSLDDAIDACSGCDKVFIIGGAQIYEQAMTMADTLIVTEVDLDIAGDAYFPEIEPENWEEIARESHHNGSLGFDFVTYRSTLI